MLDHYPVPRVAGRFVGLTTPHNIRFVDPGSKHEALVLPYDDDEPVASGRAVFAIDVDKHRNVGWHRGYVAPGSFYGRELGKFCDAIAPDVENARITQRDLDELLGSENAPLLKYLSSCMFEGERHSLVIDGRWRFLESEDGASFMLVRVSE